MTKERFAGGTRHPGPVVPRAAWRAVRGTTRGWPALVSRSESVRPFDTVEPCDHIAPGCLTTRPTECRTGSDAAPR